MKYEIEEMIESYYRKVETITDMLLNDNNPRDVSQERLITKRSVYRSVIVDLERVLKNSENVKQQTDKPVLSDVVTILNPPSHC